MRLAFARGFAPADGLYQFAHVGARSDGRGGTDVFS